MNWLKRKTLDLFYSPELGRLMEAAGGIKRAARQMVIGRAAEDAWDALRKDREWEMQQASEMLAGPTPIATRESGAGGAAVAMKERFWELELALEDRGWQRQLASSQLEFSRYGLQQIIMAARLYFIKNPLIKRGVKVSSIYVFGRGVDISSDNETENSIIQQTIVDNIQELGHCGLVEKDQTLRTDGNLYWCFFSSQSDGRAKIRTIDAIEIERIECNPDDSSEPWLYKRTWQAKVFDINTGVTSTSTSLAWYPAVDYDPPSKPATIGGAPVMWDNPILHVKTGGLPKWQFGCPEVYAEIDWARAARKHLEDWSSITEAHRRFAFTVETQGGAQAIQAFSNMFTTTLGNGGTQIEAQPAANVGSSFVTGPGNKITPMRTAGAVSSPQDVVYLIHMVCAASGLPDTFYGDSQRGNLATAQSLDRPTELQFLQRQEMWREVLQKLFGYVLGRSAAAPSGKMREASRDPDSAMIKVDFPSVLEHDINARIGAIVEAMTLNGFEVSGIDEKVAIGLLLAELGYEGWQDLIDEMYPETGGHAYDPDRTEELAAAKDATLNPPAPQGVAGPQGTDVKDALPHAPGPRNPKPKRMRPPKEAERAVGLLKQVLAKLKERGSAN